MALTVFTMEQAEQWDSTVRSFREYDTYWLSGYVKAFQLHGDGIPLLLFYEDGTTRGINAVMKRDVAKDEHFRGKLPEGVFFDFSTPYGYGGWLIEGGPATGLFESSAAWARENGIISEFVRFHPLLKNHAPCAGDYEVIGLGEVVHMDLNSPDLIWSNITSKNRNVIRKAEKNGIRIYNGRFPEIFERFRQLYNSTMDKDHAEAYYYFGESFYRSVLEDLPLNSQLFFAEKNGEVVAASIFLMANGRMNYHLSGSLREYSSLAPTNLLLYQAALWGCENGFRTLYLGGGVGSGEDSLFKFKRAFYRGELNRFYIGKKVYDRERYDELLALRGPVESDFFPKYRAQERKT